MTHFISAPVGSRALLSFSWGVFIIVLSLQVSTSHGFGSGMKVWRENTNFGNYARNWEGLVDENCSRNIFSFPGWMDPSVVAFPSTFIGKQIILPVNGHFVFQPGLTTLSDSGTCQHGGREVKFRRTSRVDWFDPRNWIKNDTAFQNSGDNKAIPHVERVPCQFDTVKFPARSTFNLLIPQNIAIAKFFLGDEEQTYTDIAVMMNSKLGKLQFQKPSEVEFKLTKATCADDDQCICDNYKSAIRTKICSLSQCSEEECHNPILPHGFCCPICGFHIRVKHNGELKLAKVEEKLKEIIISAKLSSPEGLHFYVSRHQVKGVHVIIIPGKNFTAQALRISRDIVKYLKDEPQVGDVTYNGSWEDIPSDVDKWASEGLNGGIITLIVILFLSLLIAIVCFIFYRRNGGTLSYPPFTFANLLPNFTMPSMQMPNINIPFPGRRGSTQAGGRTFGFARFSNERVSTVNIEKTAGNMERGEQVDETISPIDAGVPLEKVTDASTDFGFANVTYDIIGVTESSSTTEEPNLFESGLSATSGKVKQQATPIGPAKPTRTMTAMNNEPIYDEVIEVCDDTSPILFPEFAPKEAEE